MPVFHYLNRYANLLLVVVTVAYVLLTWRTLKALERANRRILEVEHLGEIKEAVVDPILGWLGQVVASLQGSPTVGNSLVRIGMESVPRSSDHVEEQPYTLHWKMQPPPDMWEPTNALLQTTIFADARNNHFQASLSRLDNFLKGWQQFLSDVTTFASGCATQVQAETSLQHIPARGSLSEFANGDFLVESCIWQILGGGPLHFDFGPYRQSGLTIVRDQRLGTEFAQGRDEADLKTWVQQGSRRVREQWERSTLGERRDNLLREAKKVVGAIERIRLSHFLPGDCEYVGGRTWKLLLRLKNPSIKIKNPE